jgi:23S rRNA pseudouridine1911/1915/1917 synthase
LSADDDLVAEDDADEWNDGYEYRDRIGGRDAGKTVLEYLSHRYRHSDEPTWRARLGAGEVLVDGTTARPDHILERGQSLAWRRPPWREPKVPLCAAVLYRDSDLLGIAKPRGLPSIPHGGLYLEHTLLNVVRRRWPEASPMHRLGRGTSGLLLFARTPEARQSVSAAWREGRVDKTYRALVQGVPKEAFSVDAPIGPVPHPRLGEVHAATASGKPSLSHVRRLAVRADQALVEVSIPTGRPHQIRIHLAASGHPLVGDPLYVAGGQPAADPGLPGEGGFWLHSLRLRLPHPTTGEPVEMECPPPPILRG